MADGTKIEWTDATVNAVNGCSVVSPGCKHCYAMKQAHRFDARRGLTQHTDGGMVWTGEVRLNEKALLQPLAWKRPRRIFWNAHGDLFHENVPDEWIDKVFAVMMLSPQHQHQVLTKRPARMRAWMVRLEAAVTAWYLRCDPSGLHEFEHCAAAIAHPAGPREWPLSNVWLGTSVEDQKRADERREDLRATPAAVRFVSYEPALEVVDWSGWEFLDWLISGGESGPRARSVCGDSHRSARDFCAEHEIAYFFKQHGEWIDVRDMRRLPGGEGPGNGAFDHCPFDPETETVRVGKKVAGRLLDGVEHSAMPATAIREGGAG